MANMYKASTALIKKMDILKVQVKICHNKEQIPSNLKGEMLDASERHIIQDVIFILF